MTGFVNVDQDGVVIAWCQVLQGLADRENAHSVPDGVSLGYIQQPDGSFAPPPVPVRPLDEVKSEAVKAVKQRHAETLRRLSGNASDEEMHSWPRKALAAEKYLEGTASEKQTRIIEGGADRRDMAFDAFANLILKKAETFDDLIGQADDLKERTDAAIKAADTAEEVAAILEASEAEAAAALTKWLSAA
ncbi:conserved hypothetical protein [Roseibium sp. TrichSKD4]|uniref:hypothetical protein n=1 Tax=Roseibium sp. TrichSKD4 TaxID=744980 RepID=UPI0001E56F3C|nr:hypothetical protein [Roseibium sp. TrichSKD4]EFO31319.1 conserved hypothetical protein [Roseibium sp. TrichSKD4]